MARPVLALLALVLGCDDRPSASDPPCAQTSDCPGGLICVDDACVVPAECGRTADCCPGSVCKGGVCEAAPAECAADAACGDPLSRCADGLCVRRACDAGCPRGATCGAGHCVSAPPCGARCAPGEVCFAYRDECRVAPPSCAVSCGAGELPVVAAEVAGPLCDLEAVTCECVAAPALKPADYGRHASMGLRGDEAVFAAYDADFGDLVFVEGVERGAPRVTYVDGVPDDGPVQADPSGPRGGRTAPGPDVGRYASLGVDGRRRAHVAYYDASAGALRYVRGDERGQWSTPRIVDDGGDAGRYARLRIDADGGVHVVYTALTAGRGALMYARARDDDEFEVREVSSGPAGPPRPPGEVPEAHGVAPCMALGPGGEIHAVFYDAAEGWPYVARGSIDGFEVHRLAGVRSAEWPADPGGRYARFETHDLGRACALAVEGPDAIVVVLVDADTQALLSYRGPVAGGGTFEVVDAGARGLRRFVGGDPALVLDTTGRPVVVYQDGTENDLLLNVRGPLGWTEPYAVATAGALGYYNSAVVLVETDELLIGTLELATSAVGRAAHRLHVFRQDVPAF